jgi:hypothetical protein
MIAQRTEGSFWLRRSGRAADQPRDANISRDGDRQSTTVMRLLQRLDLRRSS